MRRKMIKIYDTSCEIHRIIFVKNVKDSGVHRLESNLQSNFRWKMTSSIEAIDCYNSAPVIRIYQKNQTIEQNKKLAPV